MPLGEMDGQFKEGNGSGGMRAAECWENWCAQEEAYAPQWIRLSGYMYMTIIDINGKAVY